VKDFVIGKDFRDIKFLTDRKGTERVFGVVSSYSRRDGEGEGDMMMAPVPDWQHWYLAGDLWALTSREVGQTEVEGTPIRDRRLERIFKIKMTEIIAHGSL